MRRLSHSTLTLIATAWIAAAAAPGQDLNEPTALAGAVHAAAERGIHEHFVPGGAVALIEGGEVTLLRGYGVTGVGTSEPVTPRTIFQIGSISKTVAAWGVMRLVEQEKLDLDAPIGSVVERWTLPPSEYDADGVTIRRLLSHTAGLSVHGYIGFEAHETLPTIEESLSGTLQKGTTVRLTMEPGTKWSYSGGGYTLLQLAVEEVSGASFTDFMTREVLEPLGMASSRYGAPVDPKRFARAHGSYGAPAESWRYTALAAAGIHTTLEDMVRFAQASLSADDAPLAPETIRLMQTPAEASEGTYGLGYQCGELDGRRWVGHGGSNVVWLANMKLIPETGDGILVFTNGSTGGAMIQEVVGTWAEAMGSEAADGGTKRPSAVATVAPIAISDGIAAARAKYDELRAQHRKEYAFGTGDLISLGLYLVRLGHVDEGLGALRWAIDRKPKRSRYSLILGDTCDRLGRREEAVEAWRAAAKLGNDEAERRLER